MAIFATCLATYGFPGVVSVDVATMDAARALRSPSNMTDGTRVLVRLDGRMANARFLRLASFALDSALPVRTFFSWPGVSYGMAN